MTTTRDDVSVLLREVTRYRRKRAGWQRFWVLLVASLILAPLNGWLLMLAVGVAHAEWWAQVPTIGYGWAVLLAALLRSVFGAGTFNDAGGNR